MNISHSVALPKACRRESERLGYNRGISSIAHKFSIIQACYQPQRLHVTARIQFYRCRQHPMLIHPVFIFNILKSNLGQYAINTRASVMTDISVIGLGAMGSARAATLLANGYTVTVWNRSTAKAEPLCAAGASLAESAGSAVAASPATITCIASHEQTIELLRGLGTTLDGKTIIMPGKPAMDTSNRLTEGL